MKSYRDLIIEMADLSGMETECIPHEVLVAELNRVNNWRLADEKKRGTFVDNPAVPRIHTNAVADMRFGNDSEMIEDFIAGLQFDQVNDSIVGSNEKIGRSGLTSETFVKVGVPAFKGILYDEEKQQFFVVKTCPGAHGCQSICYARRGNYLRYGSSARKSHKILNLLINHPEQFEAQLLKELTDICTENEAYQDSFSKVTVRYNESGDFFWAKYFEIAKRVIRKLQKNFNIRATAYTKLPEIANASGNDVDVTFSTSFSKPGAAEQVNPSVRLATILPKEKFQKLFVRDGKRVKKPTISGMKTLQQLVADELGVPVENVINYHEMMRIPEGRKRKYYVLVMSGDGDDAVTRKDVKEVILAEH